MNFIEFLTMVLLSMQPAYSDKEEWRERAVRMEIVAKSIDDAAARATCAGDYEGEGCKRAWPGTKRSLAMLLVTKGYWESRFAKNVHDGMCRVYECDAAVVRGVAVHRARSPWQIQKTGLVTREEYAQMKSGSLESTTMAAVVATRHLSLGFAKCHTISGAIAIYGGAGYCEWPGAVGRYAFFNEISARSEGEFVKLVGRQRESLELRLAREVKSVKP